jgi:hypothetical protein
MLKTIIGIALLISVGSGFAFRKFWSKGYNAIILGVITLALILALFFIK